MNLPSLPIRPTAETAMPAMAVRSGLAGMPGTQRRVLWVGLDMGTANSCLVGSWSGSEGVDFKILAPTAVGHAKEGAVENLLPRNARVLHGKEAVRHRLHLRMVQPMNEGAVLDAEAAHGFAKSLCDEMGVTQDAELRAVIGIPASSVPEEREALRLAMTGVFDRSILVTKPFLAALGAREDHRLQDPDYVDPVRNSIVVDMGAGATDICLVQGGYPAADEQVRIRFGGDHVDRRLDLLMKAAHPDSQVSLLKLRELKQMHAFVGQVERPVLVDLFIQGRVQRVDLTQMIGDSCREWVDKIAQGVFQMILKADSESVPELVGNIFLTGGGSRMRRVEYELVRKLREAGVENARVHLMGASHPECVALGALKVARQARDDQWQRLVSAVE